MDTGYSGTPLARKLGITDHTKILLVHAPDQYSTWLAMDIDSKLIRKKETPDLIHLFAVSNTVFEKDMKPILVICRANPKISVWISWYKKSSGIPTDLTEDIIRKYALSHGLVDVKVCAVTEAWSGLKLVVPLAKR